MRKWSFEDAFNIQTFFFCYMPIKHFSSSSQSAHRTHWLWVTASVGWFYEDSKAECVQIVLKVIAQLHNVQHWFYQKIKNWGSGIEEKGRRGGGKRRGPEHSTRTPLFESWNQWTLSNFWQLKIIGILEELLSLSLTRWFFLNIF